MILVIAFAMIANERRREFALLRLIGGSRRMLGRMALQEAALCSLLGGAAGTILAALIVFPFTTLIETSLGLPYLTPPAAVIIGMAAASLLLTVLVGSLASAFAAVRLSRAEPGTVLRER